MLKASMLKAYSLPTHLLVGIDAGNAIDEALDRPESPVDYDRLALVHASHVGAEGFGQEPDDHEQDDDLEPAEGRHMRASRFIRRLTQLVGLEQRIEQVTEKECGDDGTDDQHD